MWAWAHIALHCVVVVLHDASISSSPIVSHLIPGWLLIFIVSRISSSTGCHAPLLGRQPTNLALASLPGCRILLK
ncbi:hypothetical protein B0J13DRAFT_544598 [Dactylonectria estremocensis]|uniref:Uncharacterized protein n=1 Tax=Dactylonectria estremocensis TaxID=1079267 RepID=A0A9P9JEC7_9HYPO|nr:hypothetical protein B0J13DRAFT_544598 [Dactylonectria estremocensis]